MSFTPPKKEKLTGIIAIIAYLAVGLLLLIRPDIMTELMRWTLTGVLGVYAVVLVVRYFRAPAEKAAQGYSLTGALIVATVALIAWFNTSWLTYRLWGVMILCGGYLKFQTAWDFFRLGHRRWWWIMIGTVVSLLLGVLIAVGVVPADVTVWFGVALLIEAALDIAVLVMVANSDKLNAEPKPKAPKEKNEAEKPAETPAAQPEEAVTVSEEPVPEPEGKPAGEDADLS